MQRRKALDPRSIKWTDVLFGDGHTIFHPEMYLEAGIPADIVNGLTHTHQSGDSHKSTITNAGQRLESCSGVYHLSFLEVMGDKLGIDYPRKNGRGSQARAICAAIRATLNEQGINSEEAEA